MVGRGNRAGEEEGSERCQGFAEGEGAMKPSDPAKLPGVSRNSREWRRRQVSCALGSLWPGRSGAGLLRLERNRRGDEKKRGVRRLSVGAGGDWSS